MFLTGGNYRTPIITKEYCPTYGQLLEPSLDEIEERIKAAKKKIEALQAAVRK
jgi:hypothetical protein